MMIGYQESASDKREVEQKMEKKLKFPGKIYEATVRGNYVYYKGEFNGHQIEGHFGVHTCDDGCCLINIVARAGDTLIVDGKPASNDMASEFAKKYYPLFVKSIKRSSTERYLPDSIDREIAAHRKEKELAEQKALAEQNRVTTTMEQQKQRAAAQKRGQEELAILEKKAA